MEPENLTVRVLIEMRDEMRGMRGELVVVNARLEGMDARLKSMDARLESVDARLGSVDARMDVIETTLLSSAEQIRMLARTSSVGIRARRAHSRRLDDLEHRVEKLERKPGA